MKIYKEKRLREEFTREGVGKIAGRMYKMVKGRGEGEGCSWYRDICKETGRSRGVIKGIVRMEWRRLADRGEIEGVRRSSW